MVTLRTHDIMIFGRNEWQVASKNLLPEKRKGNIYTKQTHGRRVNFERGCRINGQKGTNVEHSFQNNNIQKIFLFVVIYHINRYMYKKCYHHQLFKYRRSIFTE